MANNSEELIKQMYESQLKAQKEQLQNDYHTAVSDLDAQNEQNRKASGENMNRAVVDNQKARASDAEYYAAAGLTSGAKAQARLARDSQLQSDLTAIRAAQQTADAEAQRQRGLLAREYDKAIRKAQAENDLQKAQALYEEAQRKDAQILQQQQNAAAMLGAAGDFSLHGTAYGMTDEQVDSLRKHYDDALAKTAAEKAAAEAAKQAELERQKQEAAAKLMADGGDFSRYGALYGLSDGEVKMLNALYAAKTEEDTGDEPVEEGFLPETEVPGAAGMLGAALGLNAPKLPQIEAVSPEITPEQEPEEAAPENPVVDNRVLVGSKYLTWSEVLEGVNNGTIVKKYDPDTGRYRYVYAARKGAGGQTSLDKNKAKNFTVMNAV